MLRNLFITSALVFVLSVSAAPAMAQFGPGQSANNLHSQYFTQPCASQVQSGMYPAPHHVPYQVGHTYNTYQPLMPHEMMYQHNRNYYNYYNTGGYLGAPNALNKTQVRWQSGSNHMGPIPFSSPSFQNAYWRYNKHRYRLGREYRGGRSNSGCASGDCGATSQGCSGGGCATRTDGSQTRNR